MPLVENIGRKFATSQQASGVMSIMDILQEGNLALIKAVDKFSQITLLKILRKILFFSDIIFSPLQR